MAAQTSFCTALKEARSDHRNYYDNVEMEPLTKNPVQVCANRHFLNLQTFEKWRTRGGTDCPFCRAPMPIPPPSAPLRTRIVAEIGDNLRIGDNLKQAVSRLFYVPLHLAYATACVATYVVPKKVIEIVPAFEPTLWQRYVYGMVSQPAVTQEVEDVNTSWRIFGTALLASTMIWTVAKVAWNYRRH